jgi:hypothetical protein
MRDRGDDAGADFRRRVYTPDEVPLPRPWRAPSPLPLHGTPIYREDSVDNQAALDQLLRRDLPADAQRELWLALVPGSSEANGHHRAWLPAGPSDPVVEPEYHARLRHAYRLLDNEIVKYLILSGGSIDAAHPDYNEARLGRAQLLHDYSDAFARSPASGGDSLASRLIVDPFALHSVSNVRNAARLATLLGLDRLLIVTTSGLFTQGWWLTHAPPLGSFAQAADRQLGYELGRFTTLPTGDSGGNQFGSGQNDAPLGPVAAIPTAVILHWAFPAGELMIDDRWE